MQTADLTGIGSDVFVFVSGTVGGKNVQGVTTFGGDVVVSGTIYNASGGTFGSVGGSDKQVQFNDGGVLAGNSGMLFDKSTATLTVANLVITGSLTTITTSNLVVSDPLVYIASGSKTSNTNGGIAIASGSSYANQSLVFGRVDVDTWGVGRQDVSGGTATSLTSMTLAGIRSSKFEIGGAFAALSSSTGQDVNLYSAGGSFINLVPGLVGLRLGSPVAPVGVSGSDVRIGSVSVAFNNEIPPQPGEDSYFFVSGSRGSRGTTTKGTAVFGGDVSISGSLNIRQNVLVTGSLIAPSMTGSLTRLFDGTSYIEAGSNITVVTGSKGQITIASTAAASSTPQFFSSTTSASIFTTGSTAFVGSGNESPGNALAVDSPTDKGADNFFYVSGSIGKRGTAQGRNALFGGDVVVSGSTYFSSSLYFNIAAGGVDSIGYSPSNSTLSIYGGNNISIGRNGNITFNGGTNFYSAFDGEYVIGNTNNGFDSTTHLLRITTPVSYNSPNVEIGNADHAAANFLVRGDVQATGYITASLGYSGSHTSLVDGRSFLVAGSNVTITSESNGQVTISSTGGGGGSPAGSNTYVQFNDSGSFGASSTFSFEKATNTLSAQNITLGGNLDSQGVDARWYLKNNSADSLSFWDGAGGSRRFQINMGDSQERFIAYDGSGFAAGNDKDLEIVHDGTDSYINNATGKLYLSGSTSGVFVTGSAGLIVADGNQPTLTLRATTDTTNQAVFYQETGGDTYISNQKNSGKFFSSVKTSAGVAVRYLRAIPNAVNYNTIVSFVQGLHDFFDPQTGTTDVNFFVGGKVGSKGTAGQRGTALFAGDMVVSGSTHFQGGGSITGSFQIQGSITPSADSTYTLGTEQLRWGHVYTGDLHLRNERGDWTILEEEDFLCVINNKTGKKYRMMLQPLD
jgi:hypothetical protein